jgi:sugar lactone lactonase YvrE
LTFGPDGLAYVVDWNNHRIRRLDAAGNVQTIIGLRLPGDWDCQSPADPANCNVPLSASALGAEVALNHPMAVAFGADGQGYVAAWHNHKVETFDPMTLEVRVLAGQQTPGYQGDGGPAGESRLNFVDSVAVDTRGDVFVGDERNRRVRRIAPDAARTIVDVAGTTGTPAASGYAGDGGPATAASLGLAPYAVVDGSDNPPPGGAIAIGHDGTLYVADTFNHCVRAVSPGPDGVVGDGDPADEIIETVAGTCTQSGFAGDGGMAKDALFDQPEDLEFGPEGDLYIADTGNHVVRRVNLGTGRVERVAGTGESGFSGDLGPAADARLSSPYGLAFDGEGNLYVADTLNNRIRIIPR